MIDLYLNVTLDCHVAKGDIRGAMVLLCCRGEVEAFAGTSRLFCVQRPRTNQSQV